MNALRWSGNDYKISAASEKIIRQAIKSGLNPEEIAARFGVDMESWRLDAN